MSQFLHNKDQRQTTENYARETLTQTQLCAISHVLATINPNLLENDENVIVIEIELLFRPLLGPRKKINVFTPACACECDMIRISNKSMQHGITRNCTNPALNLIVTRMKTFCSPGWSKLDSETCLENMDFHEAEMVRNQFCGIVISHKFYAVANVALNDKHGMHYGTHNSLDLRWTRCVESMSVHKISPTEFKSVDVWFYDFRTNYMIAYAEGIGLMLQKTYFSVVVDFF